MHPELEAILKALDAFKDARPEDADRLFQIYLSRIDDFVGNHPGLSRETFEAGLRSRHRRWLKAQEKPASIPPKA